MMMRSPMLAMLWEQWRLTRVEAAQRFGLGLVVGSAALAMLGPDRGATAAFWFLIVLHGMVIWLSIAKLNGGRFLDGYKPGFPLYLTYVRPVPTATFVGVTLVYDAVSAMILYVVSATLFGFASGKQFPLLSVIPWIAACHLAYACVQFSTPNRVVQWVGSCVSAVPLFLLLMHRAGSAPLHVEFSLVENAVFVMIGIVAFGLTVAGVARQRRGETTLPVSGSTSGGLVYPDWLISLFKLACPTTSATRAQLWFELKCSGLPVLAIGLVVAVLIFLLFAVSIFVAPMRGAALAAPILLTIPVVFMLGGNAFGIRRRQGRSYVSAFETTKPYGTVQLATLKVLVRAASVVAALVAIAVSVWASSSLVSAWGTWVRGGKDVVSDFVSQRSRIVDALGALSGDAFAALGVVAIIAVATIVVWLASRDALRMRYPRALLVAESMVIGCGLINLLIALAGRNEIVSMTFARAIIGTLGLMSIAAIVYTTLCMVRSGFMTRSLTFPYTLGVLVIASVFAAAWLTVLPTVGVQLSEMPWAALVWVLWPVPLMLMLGMLAPWSLGRVRHR